MLSTHVDTPKQIKSEHSKGMQVFSKLRFICADFIN